MSMFKLNPIDTVNVLADAQRVSVAYTPQLQRSPFEDFILPGIIFVAAVYALSFFLNNLSTIKRDVESVKLTANVKIEPPRGAELKMWFLKIFRNRFIAKLISNDVAFFAFLCVAVLIDYFLIIPALFDKYRFRSLSSFFYFDSWYWFDSIIQFVVSLIAIVAMAAAVGMGIFLIPLAFKIVARLSRDSLGEHQAVSGSNNKTPSGLSQELPFKSGAAFLEYQCEYGFTEIKPKQGVVALVLDARQFGTKEAVKVDADGRQTVTLKVASIDGGFIVPAQTPSGKGDRLKPDDVVIWVPLQHIGDALPPEIDRRFGWVGFIVAKVAPEVDLGNPDFQILSRYD